MAALDTPIREGCHRPERVAAIVGAGVEDLLTPDRLVQVLLSTEGSTKDRPALARFAVVLNRVRAEHADLVAEIRERIGAVDGSIPVVALDELTSAEACLTSLGDQAIMMVIVPIITITRPIT